MAARGLPAVKITHRRTVRTSSRSGCGFPAAVRGKGCGGRIMRRLPFLLVVLAASGAAGTTTLPVLWTAGGLSAGIDSAGQAARIATDLFGNVAVVSGPSGGRDLPSRRIPRMGSSAGVAPSPRRWARSSETGWSLRPTPTSSLIGHNQDSHGRPIASTMLRYDSNGTLLWRVDLSRVTSSLLPRGSWSTLRATPMSPGARSGVASSAEVQPDRRLGLVARGSRPAAAFAVASSLALSPDETDVAVTGVSRAPRRGSRPSTMPRLAPGDGR